MFFTSSSLQPVDKEECVNQAAARRLFATAAYPSPLSSPSASTSFSPQGCASSKTAALAVPRALLQPRRNQAAG